MDRAEFIETQIAFQFGSCNARPGADIAKWVRSEARRRSALFLHNPAGGSFVPESREKELKRDATLGWRDTLASTDAKRSLKIHALRNASVLNELYDAGLRAPVIVDMQDAVRVANPEFPVFQYTRMAGSANAILWPHRRVHAIGAAEFCTPSDPSEPKLHRKKPVLFWRGWLRGFSTLGEEPSNIRYVIRSFLAGALDRETLLAHLNTIPRYLLVSRHFGTEGFDVGFPRDTLREYAQVPDIARYATGYAGPSEQLQHKYLVSIEGTDVGTSFGWQLGSNSVLLKQANPWQVFFDGHVRPWEHFVPVAADLSDIEEKIAWCEQNQAACETMIDKRKAVVRLLVNPRVRRKALTALVERYSEFYERWAAA